MDSNERQSAPRMQISDGRWIERKREHDRPGFIRRYPYPFVLIQDDTDDKDGKEFEFRTQTSPGLSDDMLPTPKVQALLNSGGNPYRDRVIVGRTRNCDVIIRSSDISKYHADFIIESPTQATLRDRRSSNGTTVNDKKVDPEAPVLVNPGDRIRFGTTTVLFLGPGELYDLLDND